MHFVYVRFLMPYPKRAPRQTFSCGREEPFEEGVAKLNPDWLFAAQPMRIWLMANSGLPVIGSWLAEPWVVFASGLGRSVWCRRQVGLTRSGVR